MQEINEEEKKLFVKYGSAASEAMFDFPCHFFKKPKCMGIIPYRIEHRCAIVFGEPICPPEETAKLTQAFHEFCHESNLNVIYIIVSEKFAKFAMSQNCHILMEVCDELIFDPEFDSCRESHRLRHRVEKAIKHGLTLHEYQPVNPYIENALQKLGVEWQKSIKGPHVYLGHLSFFDSYVGKRWFYVKDGDEITGMMMLSHIESSRGWLIKFLITSPNAFQGTSEFLMTSVLKVLRNENCRFVTKGMVPAPYIGKVDGLGYFSTKLSKGIYQLISSIFKFEKRKEYWRRYHPRTSPGYLVLKRPHIHYNEIRALMKVFRTE